MVKIFMNHNLDTFLFIATELDRLFYTENDAIGFSCEQTIRLMSAVLNQKTLDDVCKTLLSSQLASFTRQCELDITNAEIDRGCHKRIVDASRESAISASMDPEGDETYIEMFNQMADEHAANMIEKTRLIARAKKLMGHLQMMSSRLSDPAAAAKQSLIPA